MGPRAAGLSRSKGGAVWSPWPWPLSAQAQIPLEPHPHPDYLSGDSGRRFCVQPTSPSQPASPFLRLQPKIG
jgi:hypothetical protein